ncbi:hypothetical protein ABZ863_18820 [Saccharomonospora sp. NPDC046836]|uniref:hypothetical protein n=1 Tax=Saccharomonospora sp. NPDC046836 TaxID=3156921 RepID=UPI0033EEBE36
MTTSARAAVLEVQDGPFEFRDIEIEDPRPDETFDDELVLELGGVSLELSYKGENHCPATSSSTPRSRRCSPPWPS